MRYRSLSTDNFTGKVVSALSLLVILFIICGVVILNLNGQLHDRTEEVTFNTGDK
jgi:hypothetical protein